jgi:hypothetical protein
MESRYLEMVDSDEPEVTKDEALRGWLYLCGVKPDKMEDFAELPRELYATDADTDILAPTDPE